MSILEVFERELQTGGRSFRGTHVAGTIPLTQVVVNELLKSSSGPARDVSLEIHGANKMIVHYGAFHVEAVLADAVELSASPTLSLHLASTVVAWTVKRTVNMPGVTVEGKRIIVDVGAVDALSGYRALWPHIQSVKFGTEPGVLNVFFEVRIA